MANCFTHAINSTEVTEDLPVSITNWSPKVLITNTQ